MRGEHRVRLRHTTNVARSFDENAVSVTFSLDRPDQLDELIEDLELAHEEMLALRRRFFGAHGNIHTDPGRAGFLRR